MRVAFAGQLAIQIKRAEQEQNGYCDQGEHAADFFVQRDREPGDEQTERSGHEHMTGSGEGGDGQGLGVIPMLRARREHERQPMRRNGGVEKCDAEPGDRDGGEDGVVHEVG